MSLRKRNWEWNWYIAIQFIAEESITLVSVHVPSSTSTQVPSASSLAEMSETDDNSSIFRRSRTMIWIADTPLFYDMLAKVLYFSLTFSLTVLHHKTAALRSPKSPYSELFCSVFSGIWAEYGEILSPNAGRYGPE